MKPWFDLPKDLEATDPPEARSLRRDEVRLMVSFREKDGIAHAHFKDLPAFLRPGDLLVVNDSATLPPPHPTDASQPPSARLPGSAAMPSAGPPFSPSVLAPPHRKGTRLATIPLHTGVATLEGDEPPSPESFKVPPATAAAVN